MNFLIKIENNFQIKKENKSAVLINLINQNRMININSYSIRFSKIIIIIIQNSFFIKIKICLWSNHIKPL